MPVNRTRRRRRPAPFSRVSAAQFHALAPEKGIQSGIRSLLHLLRIVHSLTDASRVWGEDGKVRESKVDEGWPDISGVLPGGRALFVETKSRGGRLSVVQRAKISELRRAGALVMIPKSIEEFAALMIAEGFKHSALMRLVNRQ